VGCTAGLTWRGLQDDRDSWLACQYEYSSCLLALWQVHDCHSCQQCYGHALLHSHGTLLQMAELATSKVVWCFCVQGRVKTESERSDRAPKSTTCIWRQAFAEKAKGARASVHNCHIASYTVYLSEVARSGRFTLARSSFSKAREAIGAQEDAWSRPRRRLEQPLRPDLSHTTKKNMLLQPHYRFSPSVAAQQRCTPSQQAVFLLFWGIQRFTGLGWLLRPIVTAHWSQVRVWDRAYVFSRGWQRGTVAGSHWPLRRVREEFWPCCASKCSLLGTPWPSRNLHRFGGKSNTRWSYSCPQEWKAPLSRDTLTSRKRDLWSDSQTVSQCWKQPR